MTLTQLELLLDQTGYPVTYSNFKKPPATPYICYLSKGSSNFFADNKSYSKISDLDIELYTDKKDLLAESTLESLLDANELAYEKTETWIESQGLFQIIYEIGVI